MTTSSWSEHVVVLVERAVEVDVDLDALEQRERVAEARVDGVDALELVGEALAATARWRW